MTKRSKRDNFEIIATRRVNQALEVIESLEAFKNTSFYEARDEDLRKIVKALEDAVKDLKNYYFKPKRKEHFEL